MRNFIYFILSFIFFVIINYIFIQFNISNIGIEMTLMYSISIIGNSLLYYMLFIRKRNIIINKWVIFKHIIKYIIGLMISLSTIAVSILISFMITMNSF